MTAVTSKLEWLRVFNHARVTEYVDLAKVVGSCNELHSIYNGLIRAVSMVDV